jgi:hypothetical protein
MNATANITISIVRLPDTNQSSQQGMEKVIIGTSSPGSYHSYQYPQSALRDENNSEQDPRYH